MATDINIEQAIDGLVKSREILQRIDNQYGILRPELRFAITFINEALRELGHEEGSPWTKKSDRPSNA